MSKSTPARLEFSICNRSRRSRACRKSSFNDSDIWCRFWAELDCSPRWFWSSSNWLLVPSSRDSVWNEWGHTNDSNRITVALEVFLELKTKGTFRLQKRLGIDNSSLQNNELLLFSDISTVTEKKKTHQMSTACGQSQPQPVHTSPGHRHQLSHIQQHNWADWYTRGRWRRPRTLPRVFPTRCRRDWSQLPPCWKPVCFGGGAVAVFSQRVHERKIGQWPCYMNARTELFRNGWFYFLLFVLPSVVPVNCYIDA